MRLPEGEALQCLTERAINWQGRAKEALETPELQQALQRLQELNETLHRETEKEEVTEKETEGSSVIVLSDSEGEEGVIDLTDENSPKKNTKERNGTQAGCENGISKKPNVTGVGSLLPLLPSLKGDVVELLPATRVQLEELQLEGDLLEVSLDQTLIIHKVLQAASVPPRETLRTLIQIELEEQRRTSRGRAKDSKRKRKSHRGGSGEGARERSLEVSESKKTCPLSHSPSPQLPAQTYPEIL